MPCSPAWGSDSGQMPTVDKVNQLEKEQKALEEALDEAHLGGARKAQHWEAA